MTGQELYQHFVVCNADHSCDCDSWDNLDETEQAIWNGTAFEVVMRFGPPESKSGQSL